MEPNNKLGQPAKTFVSAPISLRRGAVAGLLFGLFVGIGLLLLGQFGSGTESMEGAAILAYILSLPLTLLCDLVGYSIPANHWEAFVVVAPSINGLFFGTAVVAIVNAVHASRGGPRK